MKKKTKPFSEASKSIIHKPVSHDASLDVESKNDQRSSSNSEGERKPEEPLGRYTFALFAICVFFVGTMCGTFLLSGKLLESKEEPTKPFHAKPIARTVMAFSEPEDFYPASEFRSQGAILVGCQNNLYIDPQLYVNIAKAIDRKVPLYGVAASEVEALAGVKLMKDNGLDPEAMRFIVLPSNSMWIRDYAPIILRYDNDRAVMVDAKYNTRTMRDDRKQDDFMGLELARLLGLSVRSVPLLLEGGNLISNGDGLLLTSAKTLDANLKAEFTQKQLMAMFFDYFGIHSVYTVGALQGEPNGHTDMFMTMLKKNLCVIAEIDPAVDPENSARMNENAKFVSTLNTSSGPMKVLRIPMPNKWGSDFRSYTNVILANGILLMPSYSDVDPAIEAKAEAVYRSALPDWKIKKISCDKLVKMHGQLHCISYNIPSFIELEGLHDLSFPKEMID